MTALSNYVVWRQRAGDSGGRWEQVTGPLPLHVAKDEVLDRQTRSTTHEYRWFRESVDPN